MLKKEHSPETRKPRKQFSDETKLKMSLAQINRQKDPEVRRIHSEKLKKYYADPAVRLERSMKMQEFWDTHPEKKEIISKWTINYFATHPEYVEKLKARMIEDNPARWPEVRKKLRDNCSMKNPETRAKISIAKMGHIAAVGSGRGRSSYYERLDGTYVWLRSSYELRVATAFDNLNIDWEYEPIRFDIENTTYRPDFYLSKYDIWIEVKGYLSDVAKDKIKKFILLYPHEYIRILFLEDLQELECYASNRWDFSIPEIGIDPKYLLAVN